MLSLLAAANVCDDAGLVWLMPALSFQGPIAIRTPASVANVMTSPTLLPTGSRPRWENRRFRGFNSAWLVVFLSVCYVSTP